LGPGKRPTARVRHRPNPLMGIALMISAMMLLPYLDVTAKYLGQQGIPVLQVVWARLFFGTLLTLPIALLQGGKSALVPTMPVIQAARAILLLLSTAFFFVGLSHLPVADTLSIFFVQPLILTALSPVMLGEKVGWRRWVAVIVGFIGVLIIIRPGFKEFNIGVLAALASGLCMAIYLILTRLISGSAPAMVTTYQTNMIGAVLLTITAPLYWEAVSVHQWSLMALLGLIAVAGHYCIVRAYDFAEASLLAPLAYTEMIMAVVGGWYFFGDFPDRWTFTGVAILIACAISISWREPVAPMKDFEQP
jgi:drug/metabolite transporter (DMT)-like permease